MRERLVLLVEDNPDDELLTLRALRKANVASRVEVARDGAEAVDFLFGGGKYWNRDTSRQPHVILLDLRLPKMSGFDVLRRVRADERTRRIPVVILTSSTEDVDKQQGYDLGVNSFVSKPVESVEFAQSVQSLGVYWLALNQTAVE